MKRWLLTVGVLCILAGCNKSTTSSSVDPYAQATPPKAITPATQSTTDQQIPSDKVKPDKPIMPKDRLKDKPITPPPPEPTYQGRKMSSWLAQIQDSDFDTASQAVTALLSIGEPAFPQLWEIIVTTKSDEVRHNCLNVYLRDDGKGIAWVQKAFADKNPDVSFWGAFGLIVLHRKHNTLPAGSDTRQRAIATIKASESSKDPYRMYGVREANKMIGQLPN